MDRNEEEIKELEKDDIVLLDSEKEDEGGTQSSKFFGKKKLVLTLGIVAAALVAVYVAGVVVFQSRFTPRTVVNGAEVGGKTVAEVQEILQGNVDQYVLTLKERGDASEKIAGADIDINLVFNGELETFMEEQNAFAWVVDLFRPQELQAKQMVSYDEAALAKQIGKLACLDESKMTDSQNATLSEYVEGTGYELKEAVHGTHVIRENLDAAVADAVSGLRAELDLAEAECYVEPEFPEDSEQAKAMLDQANRYVNMTVTYDLGETKEVVDGAVISQWITTGDDMSVALDQEKIGEYVAGLAEKYSTVGKGKALKTSYGQTVTVPAGSYGWKVDADATKEALIGYLEAGEDVTGDLAYSQTAASHGSADYGSTYVEINLTAQHLYFYKDGSLVVDSDFVSGNVAKGRSTPTGAYSINYKQRNAVLRGQGYASPVSFWMPFNGGVGLHDASWRGSFGGTIYKTNGSHGCINLPYSAAKTIYNNISSGVPVLVYKLSGTERQSASGSEKPDSVTAAISAIDAIGAVTLDSKGAIDNARALYEALSQSEKGYVSNYGTLTAAESTYTALVAQAQAEEQARQEQEQKEAQAKQEAQSVIDAIGGIGEVTLDSEGAIASARSKYNALSEQAKGYVTNSDTLAAAEAKLKQLKEAASQQPQQPEETPTDPPKPPDPPEPTE